MATLLITVSGAVGLGGAVIVLKARGIIPGVLVAISGIALLACYVVLWLDVVVRVHRRLLQKPWGDTTRLVLFYLALWAFPLVTFAAFAAALAIFR